LDYQENRFHNFKSGRLHVISEARGLADYLEKSSVRSLLVASSPIQLKRMGLVFRRVFRKSCIRITFVSAPEKASFDSRQVRFAIWSEALKYCIYKLFSLLVPKPRLKLGRSAF
jgi:hypothetical protein